MSDAKSILKAASETAWESRATLDAVMESLYRTMYHKLGAEGISACSGINGQVSSEWRLAEVVLLDMLHTQLIESGIKATFSMLKTHRGENGKDDKG